MSKKLETKDPAFNHLVDGKEDFEHISFGIMRNWEWHLDPKHFLFTLARYKFVSKMLDGYENVLEIGCGDAFPAPIVLQTVKKLTVTDVEPIFVDDAKAKMKKKYPYDAFVVDILKDEIPKSGSYDAVYSLDVLEHIPQEKERIMIEKIAKALAPNGVAIIGMPSLESQIYSCKASRESHVNCKTMPDFKALMKEYFNSVFMFSMNDEVVHTGFHKMANYLFAVCSHKK